MRYDQSSTDRLKARAADRVRLDLDAFLAIGDAPEVPVAISDFSSCGFSCRCSDRLTIGSPVTLRLPNLGTFPATIVWQLGVNAGARFDSPLPVSTVLSIVLSTVQEQAGEQDSDSLIDDAA